MKLLFQKKKTSHRITEGLNQLNNHVQEASQFIRQIESGNLDARISESLAKSELGLSLSSIRDHLAKIAKDEQERNWFNVGLAKFSDILRNKGSLDLHELANDILVNLVKYVNANQGALFVLDDSVKGDEYLNMVSCYAYDRKKYLNKRVNLGEGLAGQCVLEKQTIYLKETPGNYVNITSGLGHAAPKTILITPLLINDKIFGVLELASFQEFQRHKIDFIEKLSENIAASIKNVKESEHVLSLLNASQQQAEELRSQEEEMRQNMEELQATQEEMQRKSNEVNRASVEMMGILNGVNATMATIEFTPDGIVLAANSNFLKSMKYKAETDIRGKHHKQFVPQEILESEDYKTFWRRLASGEAITGIFKRIAGDGKTVWLNAIYNPISDTNNEVIKVVKFATDITSQQELLAESKGVINGINSTMATIEFTPDGKVLTANSNFLKVAKYAIEEIRGKHHRTFVPAEIRDSADYKNFWNTLASGESIKGIFKRINSEGKVVWLNAIYNPIVNADGIVIKVAKFATDITSEQELLAESKGALNGINSTMATIEFTPEGIVLDANANFLKSMQYSIDEIKGKHHKKFVPKEILESVEYKNFWSRLASGEPVTGIFKRLDSQGNTIWLRAIYSPIVNANGQISKIVKFATDITAEQEMHAETKGIINGINVTMATVEFSPDGVVLNANSNFLKSMRYSIEEIRGVHHRKFVPKDIVESEDYKSFWSKLASGESITGLFKRINAKGEIVWLNAIYNPILNSNGKVVKVVKFATDINAAKELFTQ
jgi:methyl-accepting chemotaxis protein